ncbi:DNA-processing protein DprA [Sphingobacterium humi]|uniref:DNA-protecting protein DprA n=1 Tax=Sphingobacterium humi TaxID=1796905 RepID=A0A6N8KX06_9SPHI|nr:DNA-processing protein DprA [Sphingobacterium humi]MVZ61627.1 DNA-protecting protein DprA [Sphingobacterium humi]
MSFIEKIALTKIKGIGPKLSRQLLAYFGSVENLFSCPEKELRAVPGISHQLIQHIRCSATFKAAEQEANLIAQHQIQAIWFEDEAYPNRLRHCEDAPLLLYSYGHMNFNGPKMVSIVGTRNATYYGKKIVDELLAGLKEIGAYVVSGLALGIDILAHQACIKQEVPNVAVLGHGLGTIYPDSNRRYVGDIMANGSLLTEFNYRALPEKCNFPMRNRIIAGMSDVTVVVEAGNKGGALITASYANDYNRDVCAYPGGIDQPYSAGCNQLIKDNQAHLIRHAEDLIELMSWQNRTAASPKAVQLSLIPSMNSEQLAVYQYLRDHGETGIDSLAAHLDWPASKMAATLLEMELQGLLHALPGKTYKNL